MDNVLQDKWRLICPPKNWRQPVPIDEEELSLLGIISERLSLVLTRDDERKKIYLGTALASDATTANGIRYANGWRADVVLDEDAGAEYKSVDPGAAALFDSGVSGRPESKSFRLSEFYPKGTQRPGRHTYEYIRLSPSLVNALEEIRERTGRPVTVTSGYRPPAYNREVGGVSNSCHIDGLAADIYCDGLTTAQLYDICEQVIGKRGGVGYYPKSGFIHVDVRGYEARWSGY